MDKDMIKDNNTSYSREFDTNNCAEKNDAQKMCKGIEENSVWIIKTQDKNIANTIEQSTQILKNDPCFVENYLAFCDDLINKGYNCDNAIKITDETFKILKNKDTYK